MEVKVNKQDNSQVELRISLSAEEIAKYKESAALSLSQDVKIEGFRPGKVNYEVMKVKVGAMPLWEEMARQAVNKTADQAVQDNVEGLIVGQPQVEVIKLAPEQDFEYKITVALLPKVKLGNYKDMDIKQQAVQIKTEEIDKVIDQLRQSKASEAAVDRGAKAGDRVVADINMYLDQVPLDGGQSQNTAIMMGQDYIIPGFDDKLTGAKVGETKEFNLKYPKEHHQKNLAGKAVDFKVKVNQVFERQLPPVDDNLAKAFNLPTVAELKENIQKSMHQEQEQRERDKTEITMLNKLIDRSEFEPIPDILIDSELDNMINELKSNVERQGGKFEDYLAHLKKSVDDLKADWRTEAAKRVKSALIIREIANQEKIEVTEAEINQEIQHVLSHHKDNEEVKQQVATKAYRRYLANQMANRKVINQLRDWNIK